VLSCGLVGSTALAVNLDPEDFGDIIRRLQEICTSVITHWGGAQSWASLLSDETSRRELGANLAQRALLARARRLNLSA
jgi:class 3 adenylate cyclase